MQFFSGRWYDKNPEKLGQKVWGKETERKEEEINLTTGCINKMGIFKKLDEGLDAKLLHFSQLPYRVENTFS